MKPVVLSLLLAGALGLAGTGSASAAPAAGPAVYDANCALCHQAAGAGAAGQFPRLSGRVGKIAATPAGHAYLADVVLNGMSGQVTVDGQDIVGVMPSFGQLSDADVAVVLSYLEGLGLAPHGTRFTPADIAARRAHPATPQDVSKERAALAEKKLIP